MARHVWSLLCRHTLQETSGDFFFSIVDVLDGTNVSRSTPDEDLKTATSMNFRCKLVSTWIRSDLSQPEIGTARVGLILPNRERASYSDPINVDMRTFNRCRTFVKLEVLPLRGEGLYEFLIELHTPTAWEVVARVPLSIEFDWKSLPGLTA
jgi:hypothetical protein